MKHPILHFMRNAIFASGLAMVPIVASSQDKAVVMLAKDGTSYELVLNQVERIDFNPTEVVMSGASGEANTLAYADIDKILIGTDKTGISELLAKGEIAVYPSVTTGPLTITGADAGTRIRIFDRNGVLLQTAEASDEPLMLDISNASAGVVIVQIGNHAVKVIKK